MKIDYTLPGSLPELTAVAIPQRGEVPEEPFGEQLRRLRAPQVTNWRDVLRLNAPSAGSRSLAPPAVPAGLEARDGLSQRAWWRGMLQKHKAPAASNRAVPLERMLQFLQESQQLEDQIFARHFAEDGA